MHPADRVKHEWALTFAAVAGGLAHAARQRGGALMGTAAELHKLGDGELWPRSALELERVILPDLARRQAHAGCTVRPIGGAARGQWHIQAAPLPQTAPKVLPRPVAHVAPPPSLPRPAAPAAELTAAEYERVSRLATVERNRRERERHARAVQAERVKEHAANLAFLSTANRGAAA